MARLDLNAAARPFVNERPLVAASAVLGLFLLLASMINAFLLFDALANARRLSAQLTAGREQIERAEAESKRLAATPDDREKRRLRQVAVTTSQMLQKRRLSWTRLFDQLEAVLPRDVRVLKVVPDVQENRMSLLMECTARNNEAKLAFYRKLQEAPFDSGYIMGETLEEGKVTFIVKCRYDPAGPDAVAIYEPMPWELLGTGGRGETATGTAPPAAARAAAAAPSAPPPVRTIPPGAVLRPPPVRPQPPKAEPWTREGGAGEEGR